ncbi:MAG: hypothetical protein AAGA23_18800 [Pseudomonadota bacterium]
MTLPGWLQPLLGQLRELRDRERLPHALLLLGDGPLKELAHRFANDLLCLNGPIACGECNSCCWVDAGTHPDLKVVEPAADSKSGQITVDQVRQLAAGAGLTGGGNRIYIVHPANAMNLSAANALLKTLEEPPPGSVFLLCCRDRGRLPATIFSRCQVYPAPSGSHEEVARWLADAFPDREEAEVRGALQLASGEASAAFELLAGEHDFSAGDLAEDLKRLETGRLGVTELAKRWTQDGLGGLRLAALSRQLHQRARKAPATDLTTLYALYDATCHTRRVLATSARPELQMEALLLNWREKYGEN